MFNLPGTWRGILRSLLVAGQQEDCIYRNWKCGPFAGYLHAYRSQDRPNRTLHAVGLVS